MNFEQRLNAVVDRYRNLGFKVVLHPSADDLPPFARDFNVQILAAKDDGSVLAVAKASPSELEADPEAARYSEVTDRQPSWRLDVFVLGEDAPAMPENGEAREPADEDIRRATVDAERLLREGYLDRKSIPLRKRSLALLGSFLEDDASRDRDADKVKYDGPCAGFLYRVLSVRNLAALEMASLLDIDVPLDPDRGEKEWAAVRSRVKEAWKLEQAAKPKDKSSRPK